MDIVLKYICMPLYYYNKVTSKIISKFILVSSSELTFSTTETYYLDNLSYPHNL